MTDRTQQTTTSRRNAAATILLVEDEPEVRELLVFTLRRAGYNTLEAGSAEDAIACLDHQLPDLIVIDWMLPGMNGIEFARYVRRDDFISHLPLIMLTARTAETDKLHSFESGLDDFLSKPFSPRELLARIRALLRRSGVSEETTISYGRLSIDLENYALHIDGAFVRLGRTEFNLLAWLVRNADKPFQRSELLDRVWGRGVYLEERTVDVHILRLRKVLKRYQLEGVLQTVRGVGYSFSSNAASEPSSASAD